MIYTDLTTWYGIMMPDTAMTDCLYAPLPWTSYQVRKIAGCACAGNAGTFSRHRLQRKSLVSDPGMHHGTCSTHVPWCISGSLTRGDREYVFCIPGTCATRNFAYLARSPLPWKDGGLPLLSVSNTERFCLVLYRSSGPLVPGGGMLHPNKLVPVMSNTWNHPIPAVCISSYRTELITNRNAASPNSLWRWHKTGINLIFNP